ncbi:inorganic phosphate transporter family protein [candidate division KSB1 bacterium]|nr:inorganic phosphate transporter family protein [candidate division KSB1 bacterium]
MLLVYLSSGLFLGWSLGANDAANVFGTAVGSKMVRFKVAATICGIFFILGAVTSGGGATETLGRLGSVNAIAGAFMVTFAAGFTVFWMTKLKMPVSTTQAIVGAIVGWNLYSGSLTDYNSLTKILSTWVLCPLLAAIFSMIIFLLFKLFFNHVKIHLFRIDSYTRTGLILVGAFGAFSLGANNIANVMGVFVPVAPFQELHLFGRFTLTSTEQLFLLGSIAIAVGVFTYSKPVMETIGSSLLKLSPEAALVVVLAQSLVLFLFASEGLENWLLTLGLPTIPLVPVSSSQAVVGAVIGIGMLKGGRTIKFKVLQEIACGWISTPLLAGSITFISLFFLQNVFNQQVYQPITFNLNREVIEQLATEGISDPGLAQIKNEALKNQVNFYDLLTKTTKLTSKQRLKVIEYAAPKSIQIDSLILANKIARDWFSDDQLLALDSLIGRQFNYAWQFRNALQQQTSAWCYRETTGQKVNEIYNRELNRKYQYILDKFQRPS